MVLIDYVFCHILLFYLLSLSIFFFFFNDTATTEIYTLSLHDALPISPRAGTAPRVCPSIHSCPPASRFPVRSEEHTSELQSRRDLVCRLLLEKKKKKKPKNNPTKEYHTSPPTDSLIILNMCKTHPQIS